MKALILALLALSMIGCSFQTELLQPQSELKSKTELQFEKAYLDILRNGEASVIEDALFIILNSDIHGYIKISEPMNQEIKTLVLNGETEKIRNNALLISNYMDSEDKLKAVKIRSEYQNKTKMFDIVASMAKEENTE
jgi:hypothetical protein